MKHRSFDDEFKKMAVELSKVKGSVKEAAEELNLATEEKKSKQRLLN